MVSKRLMVSIAVGFVVYMIVTLILALLLQPTPTFVGGRYMMESSLPTTTNNDYVLYLMMTSMMSIIIGSVAGALTYHFYPEEKDVKAASDEAEYAIDDVVWGILNENEKKVMEEVVKSPGVTQDSLVHRLGYSKAKLSLLLSDLEKKDLVMRQKLGRTNSILLTERMKAVLSKDAK